MSVAYAEVAPELESTLNISAQAQSFGRMVEHDMAHLTRIASLMLNRPGFSSIPNNLFPLGIHFSLARACPSGYVARMTKYEEKDGAFDLK